MTGSCSTAVVTAATIAPAAGVEPHLRGVGRIRIGGDVPGSVSDGGGCPLKSLEAQAEIEPHNHRVGRPFEHNRCPSGLNGIHNALATQAQQPVHPHQPIRRPPWPS